MKIVGFVPARSGSRGLPGKNIKVLAGKPLIAHSIIAAVNCSRIDEVYISSDSEEYLSVGSEYGALPHRRPKSLADSSASMQATVSGFLADMAKEGKQWDAVKILLPVYPFRRAEHLDAVLKEFEEAGGDRPLVGFIKPRSHPYLCFEVDERHRPKSILDVDANKYYRRQDYPEHWEYCSWALVLPTASLPTLDSQMMCKDSYAYKIPEEIPHINIDTEEDFDLAEFLLQKGRFSL